MIAYPKLLSLSGWVLVAAGSVAVVASLVGIASVLWAASRPGVQHADEQLHDVYYVIQPHWTSALAFFLCLAFSGTLVFVGLQHTKKNVVRTIEISRARNIEPGA